MAGEKNAQLDGAEIFSALDVPWRRSLLFSHSSRVASPRRYHFGISSPVSICKSEKLGEVESAVIRTRRPDAAEVRVRPEVPLMPRGPT